MNALSDLVTPLLPPTVLDTVLDAGYIPHALIRVGIRRQLASRLASIPSPANTSLTSHYASKMKYVEKLSTSPIAIETDKANQQHYEVGTGVLKACLGPRMKYSCCLYDLEGKGAGSLAEAEDRMLGVYVERAGLRDGMRVLDLGCGWGSLSLYLAALHRNSQITAFSNSATQKLYIDSQAKEQGLTNLTIITGDVVDYDFIAETYDRVLSIELFEHMKNYSLLLSKVSRALKPGGKLFVHIFAHKDTPYDFESDGSWMSEHFFTGGTMPSADLLLFFQQDLKVSKMWWVSGKHYARTCEDWLAKMVASRAEIWPHLMETYGQDDMVEEEMEQTTRRWWNRWQIFYLACAELFAYRGGDVWGVCHYLFEKGEGRLAA